jgi:hypothetical protein
MSKDDVRLGGVMGRGLEGDVVLMGYPHQHGHGRGSCSLEDGPDCMRRFLGKVGPVRNPEYGMAVTCSLTDYGNIFIAGKEVDQMQPPELLDKLRARCQMVADRGGLFFLVAGVDPSPHLAQPCLCLTAASLPLPLRLGTARPAPFPRARFESTYELGRLLREAATLSVDLRLLSRGAFPGAEGERGEGAEACEVLEWMWLAGCRGKSVAVWGFDPRREDYVSGLLVCNLLYALALGRSNPGAWLCE